MTPSCFLWFSEPAETEETKPEEVTTVDREENEGSNSILKLDQVFLSFMLAVMELTVFVLHFLLNHTSKRKHQYRKSRCKLLVQSFAVS